MKRPYPIVFILGMHRSGTSCLAGCLEACGLYLGKVDRFRQDNRRGNLELLAVNDLQDEIFSANGGTWSQPPDQITVNPEQQLRLKQILAGFPSDVMCGLKDPRMLLLMDDWIKAAGDCTFVGIYRHPLAVAESLAKRNQIPADQACRLWLRYNAALIQLHQQHHFPLVEFDLGESETYAQTVAAIASHLGLTPAISSIRAYLDTKLDHCRTHLPDVPSTCQEAYTYLRSNRYRPNDTEMKKLETLRHSTAGPSTSIGHKGLLTTLGTLRSYAGALEKSNLERGEWGQRLDGVVRQQEGRLGEQERTVQSQQQTIQSQQATIQGQEEHTRQYQDQVRRLEQDLLAKGEALTQQAKELTAQAQRLHDQDERISEQTRTIERQAQDLTERQTRLQQQEQKVAEQEHALAEHLRATERQVQELARLHQQVTEREAQLNDQQQKATALSASLQDRDKTIAQLEEQVLREQERAIRDREAKLAELTQLAKTQAEKIAWQDEALKAKRDRWERLYHHWLFRAYRWLKRGGHSEQ